MASRAIGSKHAAVEGRFSVAGDTVAGCAFEDAILVALAAVHIEMSAGQLEGREIVVETCGFPACRGMA